MMLDAKQIKDIATTVASENLSNGNVVKVESAPIVDSEGDAALKITIVLTPGSSDSISGDAALNTLFQMQRRLQEAGEDRFAFVEYATPDELTDVAD
jgi:hypothetical protein